MEDAQSQLVRIKAFEWLASVVPPDDPVISWQELAHGFRLDGTQVPLIGAKGIWKSAIINHYPISICTTIKGPYTDSMIGEDILHYSYRGKDLMHSDNVALRDAMKDHVPLIYLYQIVKGKYYVVWPVYVVGDEPRRLRFTIAFDTADAISDVSILLDPESKYRRKYQSREVLSRLHQSAFRERVLHAYKEHCAICNLKHRELLDAAHIIPDKDGGEPIVPNGLALCKIHHAAFDMNFLGITPDYTVEIREDILVEKDGPMLKYGLQEAHKAKLILPKSYKSRPNKDMLEKRYRLFSSSRGYVN